jgi:hypothetical protein
MCCIRININISRYYLLFKMNVFKCATIQYAVFIKRFIIQKVLYEFSKIIDKKTRECLSFMNESDISSEMRSYQTAYRSIANDILESSDETIWIDIFNNHSKIDLAVRYYVELYKYLTSDHAYLDEEEDYVFDKLNEKTANIVRPLLFQDYVDTKYNICTLGVSDIIEFIKEMKTSKELRDKMDKVYTSYLVQCRLKNGILADVMDILIGRKTEGLDLSHYYEYISNKPRETKTVDVHSSSFMDLVDLSLNTPFTLTVPNGGGTLTKDHLHYRVYLERHTLLWISEYIK